MKIVQFIKKMIEVKNNDLSKYALNHDCITIDELMKSYPDLIIKESKS